MAEAQEYVIEREARGNAKAAMILAETDAQIAQYRELAERTSARVRSQEMRRQENLEAIAEEAIPYLPPVEPVGNVSDDWIAQFFDFGKDVSDADLRTIWAQLLASEIGRPSTVSSRTLRTLQVLSPTEAHLFSKAAGFAVQVANIAFLPWEGGDAPLGVSYAEWLALAGIDLLYTQSSQFTVSGDTAVTMHLTTDEEIAFMPGPSGSALKCVLLTSSGFDLARVIDTAPPPADYPERIAVLLRNASATQVAIRQGT
jgi:hypothetical protein